MAKKVNVDFINWIGKLCGQQPQPTAYACQSGMLREFPVGGIGCSQLNELLLMVQLDRVSEGFFNYVFGASIVDFETFCKEVDKFVIKAMIKYGHVKYGFKRLSNMDLDSIKNEFDSMGSDNRKKFMMRREKVVQLKSIPAEYAPYLGYLTQDKIKNMAKEGKSEQEKKKYAKILKIMEKTISMGEFNHHCYLDYDYIDVYVATSMRKEIDYWNMANFVNAVFGSKCLDGLNLRYFDPTQAYCVSRVDKGLAEALMLKRAKCTIYMAGESDSLGKDSELAATLAQGKPVIVYVPRLERYEDWKADVVTVAMKKLYGDRQELSVAMEFLQLFYPEGAWEDDTVKGWLSVPPKDVEPVWRLVFEKAKKSYDGKAHTLLDRHPLGLQVNLETGVANGVIVSRKVDQCANLLRKVLLNELEFELKNVKMGEGAAELREKETGSLYRVATGDRHLVNSFWNFYLKN